MSYKLTKRLKAFAAKRFAVPTDATDAEFRRVIGVKVAAGKLPIPKLRELAAVKSATDPAAAVGKAFKTKKKKSGGVGLSADDVTRLIDRGIRKGLAKVKGGDGASAVTPAQMFAKSFGSDSGRVRVKSAAELYSTSTKEAFYPNCLRKDGRGGNHPWAGQPARFAKQTLSHPSDLAKAVSAAWLKWQLHHQTEGKNLPQNLRLTDHDRDLCFHAMKNMAWTGSVGAGSGVRSAFNKRKLNELELKTLLDDTISGGIEAAPSVFDDAIILFPVLYGELFPFVDVKNVARGRRIKGASMQRADFVSGPAEGTAISPFNTASFIGAFDTPIFAATGAMEIGLDFEDDTPVALGGTILDQFGEQALVYLDRVIAIGNGYNEPLGIFNTSGLTVTPTDNGVVGPPTVSDYEGLYFGLAKQYRNEPGAMLAYVGNDTSYRRTRSIQVGSDDQRRVFGMNPDEYQILGKPFKVQNGIANSKVAFVNLKRYRMYRRLGLSVKMTDQGRSLALSNTRLIVLRMRFGGQMETANAVAVSTDAQE